MTAATASHHISSPGWKTAVGCACLAAFAFSANYTNHAPLVPMIRAEFGLPLSLAGFLTTAIFLTHGILQVPGGYLADRFGPRWTLIVAMALVAAANAAISLSGGFSHLIFWKALAGVGTGASIIAGARYVHAMAPPARMAVAQGLYGGSILLGSGFVILALPRVAQAAGWRNSFLVTAAIAAAAWLIWTLLAPRSERPAHVAAPWGELLASGVLWRLGVVQMASFGLVISVSSWITLLLRQNLGLSPAAAGPLGSSALLLGILTRPAGGALAARLGRRRLLAVSLSMNVAGCLLLGESKGSPAAAVIGLVLLGIGCGLPYASLFKGAGDLFPKQAGAAMGLVNVIGIAMILAAPPAIGALVDTLGDFRFSLLALAAVSALALFAVRGLPDR